MELNTNPSAQSDASVTPSIITPDDSTSSGIQGLTDDSFASTPSDSEISGLSQQEIKDPNQIQVAITDERAPIVVLFGPGKCGKTMTQIRLARYLHTKGYSVDPERNFRPGFDKNYQDMCDKYPEFVNNLDAANSTDMLSFMLLGVQDSRGNKLCQILEAPGEHYHSIQNPQAIFPAYINQLIASNVRKIWVITLEPNWIPKANCQQYNRPMYVEKIKALKNCISSRDKVIFLYNKIDATNLMQGKEQVNRKAMIKQIADNFPGIFAPFKNTNPITSLWKSHDCKVLPFSTGTFNTYTQGTNLRTTYTVGSDVFPAALWKAIMQYVKG